IAGQGIANPIATILAARMLLEHLGEQEAAERVEQAVAAVLAEGAIRTPDLGGDATMDALTEAIVARITRARS
ncbi:MAG TPA: isocitrate/isopropylmalate family dehydrogenase, partial [Chloroflexota bacterium]|nr:isocitrate/isopropylmalate family dehydrogenase [Chloroflexota bacterium]